MGTLIGKTFCITICFFYIYIGYKQEIPTQSEMPPNC